MIRLRTMLAAMAVMLGASILAPAAHAQTPQGPSSLIIFDGSGSIWGRLDVDKRAKFEIAREAVRQSLAKAPPTARMGLMSFGHRRRGDCSDIELITPVETGTADRINASLDKLNPRGKGPIAQSLREAAKVMKDQPSPSIVLIADNADNCIPDACSAADEIAKAQPGLPVHVIGIGLNADEARMMLCIAKATKGKFQNVENAAALTLAIDETLKLALQREQPPEPKLQAAPKLVKPGSKDGPPGISLTAQLAKGGPMLDMPVRWQVTKDGDGATPALLATGQQAVAQLAPGKYNVEARIGLVTVRQSVDVAPTGTTDVAIPLEAALITLSGRGPKGTDPPASAVVTVLPAADGKPLAQQPPLLVSRESDGILILPAGNYVIRVEHGVARKDFAIQHTAGARSTIDTTLGAGRLQVWAQAQDEGEALEGALFSLSEDDPDSPQGRREVVRSAATRPEFVVPSGTYYLTAQLGPAIVRQRLAVGIGDIVKRPIVMGLARLQVSIDLDSALARLNIPVSTRVLQLEAAAAREVARSTSRKPEFVLVAGKYRIEAQAGDQNARAVSEFEIKPGRNLQMSMRIEAGQIALKAVESAGGFASPEAFWEIEDSKGRLVWRTSQSEPRAILAPGRYLVRSDVRERRLERTLDVAIGESRLVEMAPQ